MTLDQKITLGANSAFIKIEEADQRIITETYNMNEIINLSFLEIASMKKSIVFKINASVGNPQ